jgi:hypothetical protein
VPSAIALTAVYKVDSWTQPTGEPVDPKTRSYFLHSLGSIAVRARAAIMSDLAGRRVGSDGNVTRWTSTACGAAIPVLYAIAKHVGSQVVDLKLVDIDQNALDHARDNALARGLVEHEDFELLNRNVIKDSSTTSWSTSSGRKARIWSTCSASSHIDEDFDGFKSAVAFLANAFRLVKPEGPDFRQYI